MKTMRVKTVKSAKGSISYAIIQDIKNKDGKRSTQIVKNLGNHNTLKKEHPEMEPLEYAKKVAKEMTEAERKGKVTIIKTFDTTQPIDFNRKSGHDIGYLFLDKLFYELKLDRICTTISKESKVNFDLTQILKTLISTRILHPGSKRNAHQLSQSYLTQPKMALHQIYRALDHLGQHHEYIQEAVYKNSQKILTRNTQVLYYDCTNFFFDIEEEDDLRKYGKSKEHRPNPIVQMGLFLDGSGLPLAYTLFPGNQNEQPTLKPLEKRIIRDFDLSEMIVCTDGGLSSVANRQFNSTAQRHFVTTQSIKKLRKPLKEWALNPVGWKMAHLKPSDPQYGKTFDLTQIKEEEYHHVYYKETWEPTIQSSDEKQCHITPRDERYVVTYSPKYKLYQTAIRSRQVERAKSKLNQANPLKTKNPNSPDRFIERISVTQEGELAKDHYMLNQDTIDNEAQYDGFYCVATDLERPVEAIIAINQGRWEIEASFRLLKTEFKSRPVYLSRENRIQAHFLVCYLALLILRIFEKRMGKSFSIQEIIQTLKGMSITSLTEDAYLPHYTRTNLTDRIHDITGFRTDYQLMDKKYLKKIEKFVQTGK